MADPREGYGLCPQCGAEIRFRERRPNGDDTCYNGHKFPSREAVPYVQQTELLPKEPAKPKRMTQQEYLDCGGSKCPYCRGEHITAEILDADGRYASGEVTCEYCGKIWQDQYELTGYESVVE